MSVEACVISLRCPAVKVQRSGIQASLRERFSFVVNPPRLRPSACASCPPFFFSTGCAGVCAHHRGINEDRRDFASSVKMFMQCFKDTRIAPSAEPAINRIPMSIDFRDCPPSRSLFCDPKQGREETPTGFGIPYIDVSTCFEKR